MKRSEMLSILERELRIQLSDTITLKELSSNLLLALETNGMLPPTRRVSENTYMRGTGEYGYDINEWEDEV